MSGVLSTISGVLSTIAGWLAHGIHGILRGERSRCSPSRLCSKFRLQHSVLSAEHGAHVSPAQVLVGRIYGRSSTPAHRTHIQNWLHNNKNKRPHVPRTAWIPQARSLYFPRVASGPIPRSFALHSRDAYPPVQVPGVGVRLSPRLVSCIIARLRNVAYSHIDQHSFLSSLLRAPPLFKINIYPTCLS